MRRLEQSERPYKLGTGIFEALTPNMFFNIKQCKRTRYFRKQIMKYSKSIIINPHSMREGEFIREMINFIIAVAAQVVGNLLCEWLYSKRKDDN